MRYRRHVPAAVAAVVMLIQSSAALAQVQQPRSDREYFDAPRETIIQSLQLSPPRLTEPLERTIHEEMKSLAALTGLPDAVWIVRGGGAHSHPDVGVIVDLDQIAAIKRSMPDDEFLPVLRWIIAHEQAHQVQFRQYSPSIANADPPDREVYEAQADILAGKYLIETLANTTEQDRRGVTNTLKAAFALGVERYALADHPSKEGRLTAARLGMAAGMMVKMMQLGTPGAMESAATLARTLDYHGGEEVLPWSLRTARRIVNYRRPAIVDLVLVEERTERALEPGRSVTSYWFTYDNRGTHDLFVDEEVQCVTAPPGESRRCVRVAEMVGRQSHVLHLAAQTCDDQWHRCLPDGGGHGDPCCRGAGSDGPHSGRVRRQRSRTRVHECGRRVDACLDRCAILVRIRIEAPGGGGGDWLAPGTRWSWTEGQRFRRVPRGCQPAGRHRNDGLDTRAFRHWWWLRPIRAVPHGEHGGRNEVFQRRGIEHAASPRGVR